MNTTTKLFQAMYNCSSFVLQEDGTLQAQQGETKLPIVLTEQDGRIWLEVTVYDPEMDDGRELVFEVKEY